MNNNFSNSRTHDDDNDEWNGSKMQENEEKTKKDEIELSALQAEQNVDIALQTVAAKTKDEEAVAGDSFAAAAADAEEPALAGQASTDSVRALVCVLSAALKRDLHSTYRLVLMFSLLCITNFFFALCTSTIGPYFPKQALKKGGTMTHVGIVMSSYDAVRCLTAPLLGVYIHTIGVRFMLLAGPFIVAVSIILFGTLGMAPPGVWFFILSAISRMLAGFGTVFYAVPATAIQPMLFGKLFGFAYGFRRAVSVLGAIAGPALGGVLYTYGGYTLPFWVLGGASLCAIVIQFCILPDFSAEFAQHQKEAEEKRQKELQQQRNAEKAIEDLKKKHVGSGIIDAVQKTAPKRASMKAFFTDRHMCACFMANVTVGFTVMFYNSSIALQILPLVHSVPKAGYIMVIASIAEVIMAPAAGLAQDRFLPPKISMAIYYSLCATAFAIIGPTPVLPFLKRSLPSIIIGIIIYGCALAFGFSAPFKMAYQQAISIGYPSNQHTHGIIAGCLITCTTFGGFLGPLVGGVMQDLLGYQWSSTIVSALLVIMAGIALVSQGCHFVNREKPKS